MKMLARKALKIPPLLTGLLGHNSRPGYAFLIYHSVAGNLSFELDIPFAQFRRQIKFLAQTGSVIDYGQALRQLQAQNKTSPDSFVLTFDDGFLNFYTHIFPLLQEFDIPAILFVTTGFVEDGTPYPILRHAQKPEIKSVTWDMLGEMAASGLVALGAHTHTHPNLDDTPDDKVQEELMLPKELFRKRLGMDVQHFAYPKALWNRRVEKFVMQHYTTAVISGGLKASSGSFNPYRIPRIPIRCSDGWFFFLAKTRGWLADEEAMYVRLRKLYKI